MPILILDAPLDSHGQNGLLEQWNSGKMFKLHESNIPIFQYSIIPLFHSLTLHPRHLGEHFKQDREILLREPHAARGRKHLISYRCGG